jgi:acetoin:2,6-dichlorophenolindophenol oxidoreductase subunit alpha
MHTKFLLAEQAAPVSTLSAFRRQGNLHFHGRPAIHINARQKKAILKRMVLIRVFEEKAGDLFQQKLIPGFIHLSIGQEASTVGSCSALRPDDYIISTHRGHAHILAKGADPKYMYAELFGKSTGYCKGKGGSMHIADFSLGILGANGVVGGGFPIMIGAGLSIKLRKTDQVGMVFFGDGASNRGTFHEAANMAAVFKLPIVFVCENNNYASTSRADIMVAGPSIAARAQAYGMPGHFVDGSNVLDVLGAVQEAVDYARSGNGPSLVETSTYRYRGHFEGDKQKYRTAEEIHAHKLHRDPIDRFEKLLLAEDTLVREDIDAIWEGVNSRIDDAIRYGMESPQPQPEDALKDLFINP